MIIVSNTGTFAMICTKFQIVQSHGWIAWWRNVGVIMIRIIKRNQLNLLPHFLPRFSKPQKQSFAKYFACIEKHKSLYVYAHRRFLFSILTLCFMVSFEDEYKTYDHKIWYYLMPINVIRLNGIKMWVYHLTHVIFILYIVIYLVKPQTIEHVVNQWIRLSTLSHLCPFPTYVTGKTYITTKIDRDRILSWSSGFMIKKIDNKKPVPCLGQLNEV